MNFDPKRFGILIIGLTLLILNIPQLVLAFETEDRNTVPFRESPILVGGAVAGRYLVPPLHAGHPIHQTITETGLSFLKPDVLARINQGQEIADLIGVNQDNPAYHFDSCNFSMSASRIRVQYGDIISLLKTRDQSKLFDTSHGDKKGAFEQFGEILHTMQDFYSHTNWVELREAGFIPPIGQKEQLIDNTYTLDFKNLEPNKKIDGTSVYVIEGNDLKDRLTRPDNGHIVYVDGKNSGKVGLISGVADKLRDPNSFGKCPPKIALGHWDPYFAYDTGDPKTWTNPVLINNGTEKFPFTISVHPIVHPPVGFYSGILPVKNRDGVIMTLPIPPFAFHQSQVEKGLNKDDPSRDNHEKAKELAIFQTRHEWCRLLNLVALKDGKNGVDYLLDNWAGPNRETALNVCPFQPPVADAGDDKVVNDINLVVLDGSRSSDPDTDPGRLKYLWEQESGPAVFIKNKNRASASFISSSLNAPGVDQQNLVFNLTVSDGIYARTDHVTITVGHPVGTSFTVNTNADHSVDLNQISCTPDECTLREAIYAANSHPGRDIIKFNLPSDQTTITLQFTGLGGDPNAIVDLPDITDSIIVDGTTQPGFIGSPIVEIRPPPGNHLSENGLKIHADNSVVRGLVIGGFDFSGIQLNGKYTDTIYDLGQQGFKKVTEFTPSVGNVVEGNYVGLARDGITPNKNGIGIDIETSKNNKIGGPTQNERNIISGNVFGIRILEGIDSVEYFVDANREITHFCSSDECASSDNGIHGNYIGTDVSGTVEIANSRAGVAILGSPSNIIGGDSINDRNIISGNGDGIWLSGDRGVISHDNVIQGNYIGLDASGSQELPNSKNGIHFTSYIDGFYQIPAAGNKIGGTIGSERNIISGNTENGILIEHGSIGNFIEGNYIGTDSTGSAASGNSGNGIRISNTTLNIIGSNRQGSTNIISGNSENGVEISGHSSGIYLFNNYIGTDISGTHDLGNLKDGVAIADSSKNVIGSQFPSSFDVTTSDNPFKISVNAKVTISATYQNVFGSQFPFQKNLISNNDGNGVTIIGDSATQNMIEGNEMYGNGKLGIDLNNDGVSANDDGDGDTGPNYLLNFPQGIAYYDPKKDVSILKGNVTLQNNLDLILIDFYSNEVIDESNHGEGRRYIGNWIPNNQGVFRIELKGNFFNQAGDVADFNSITAVALFNGTSSSEFSEEFRLVKPPTADAGIDKVVHPNTNITLDGTNSTAQNALIRSYSWEQVGGNYNVTLINKNSASPTFISPNSNDFALLFRLIITDTNGVDDTDYVLTLSDYGIDDDSDGIETQVDTKPFIFSNDFSDKPLSGNTSGNIVSRGNNLLVVTEEPNPAGVRITAQGTRAIQDISNIVSSDGVINACNNAARINAFPGADFILTCGSVHLDVKNGLVEAELFAQGGSNGTLLIDSGNKASFEPISSLLHADSHNLSPLFVFINESQFQLSPGDSIFLSQPEIRPSLTADAGPDLIVPEGSTNILLSGQGSIGNITSYTWQQLSGPNIVNLIDASPYAVSFDSPSVNQNTTLTFALVVRNEENLTDVDTVNVLIQDIPGWGSEGTGPGEFDGPQGLEVDRAGNVYVADSFNHRIQKFSGTGDFITSWGGFGTQNGRLNYPTDVALDFHSNFNIYTIEGDNDRVQKFSKDNEFLTKWGTRGTALGQFRDAQSITVDSSNNVYVADTINHRIQKFTDAGNFITAWGTFGSQDGQFNRPTGIATDSSNNVYVVDSFNYRVQKFSSTGDFIRAWGEFGSENSQFDRPTGITVDSSNNVYVADTFNNRIQVFDENGNFKQAIYRGLIQPYDISLDILGNTAYVSDFGNNRIQIFNITNQNGSQQNSSPLAIDQSVFSNPHKSVLVNLTATDDNINDILIFTISRPPVNGTLSQFNGTIGSVIYTPNLNFQGSDSFGFKVSDGIAESFGTISISIGHIPKSLDQTVTTDEDIPVRIQLNGTDIDNDPLTFTLDTGPLHGHIEQLNPQNGSLLYIPDANYNENTDPNTKFDMFTFRVNDGSQNSNLSTVKVNVKPVNDIPVAYNFSITTYDPLYIHLNATDADRSIDTDDDPTTEEVGITYSIVKQPEHGELGPLLQSDRIRYIPNVDFVGTDKFTFEVTDGKTKSNIATISVKVKADDKVIERGDIFVPGLTGVLWFYPNGTFYRHLDVPLPKGLGNPEAMAFDPAGNLYVADDQDGFRVSKFSETGAYIGRAIDSSTCLRITDMVFDNSGNMYLGCFYSGNEIEKYDSAGNLVSVYDTDGNPAGFSPAFFDLSCDQKTMFYTENTGSDWPWAVKRYDIAENKRLQPDFVHLPAPGFGSAFDPQILPDGGLLVGTDEHPYRLDDSGKIIESYAVDGVYNGWGVLELDTDSKSFWVEKNYGILIAEVLKIDINTGKAIGKLVFPSQFLDFKGPSAGDIVVKGSYRDALANTNCEFPPVVHNVTATTQINTPLDILLTGNDRNKNNSLIFEIQRDPEFGTLTNMTSINSTTVKLTYIPNHNFTGKDSFTYSANDGKFESNLAVVDVDIGGSGPNPIPNSKPVATGLSASTITNHPVKITLFGSDLDSDLLSFSIVTSPTSGIISSPTTVNSFRSVINSSLETPPNTSTGTGLGLFQYNLTSKLLQYSVNYTGLADPETAAHIHSGAIGVPGPIEFPLISGNIKSGTVGPLTQEQESKLLSGGFYVNIHSRSYPDGEIRGQIIPNGNAFASLVYTSNPDFNGTDRFQYSVNDGKVDSDLANITIAVRSPQISNKPPEVTILKPNNGSKFTVGNPVTFSGSANDQEDGNISSGMTWESNIDGPLGTGANIVASSLSQGTHSITASVIDSGQLSNSSSIEIFVNMARNKPPVAVGDHFKTSEDTPVNLNVITNDTDPENDDLTIAAINQTANNGQAIVNNNNNTINYSPNRDFTGQDSLIYTITDGHGGKSSAQVFIDVLAINDNPIARNDSTATNKNSAVLIDVLANDTDVDNDPITISQTTTPAHGSAIVENAKIKYTPNLSFVGIDKFDYTISDGNGGNAKGSITVNVKSVNQTPVATDGSSSTNDNTALEVKLNATDPDNDRLTFIIDTQPTHGSISAFNSNNGTLTYTPQIDFTGQDSLKFKVNDGTSDSNVATVLINVKNVNHSPVAENQNVVTPINKQIEITLKGHDPDASDKITFVKVTDPAHGIIAGFDSNTGKLTYIPNNGFAGKDSFSFKVIDNNKAESSIATVSITVNALVNKPPIASNINVETSQDTAKVIALVGTDPDAGDKITYHIISAPSLGSISSIDQANGKVTYTPNKGFLGLDSFTYKVTDLSGANSNIATVGISVKSTSTTPYPIPPSCSPNDKSGGKALRGTNSDDVIIGTEAGDTIQGLSGNDAINGCGASDNLNGNAGNDGIAGGTREDNIHGNNGNDYLRGDEGNDVLYGGEGDDVLVGGPGRDSFYCGSGNDKVLDFNVKEGDALQKQSNTKGRDATQKSDCENAFSVSSTSISTKFTSQTLSPNPTERILSGADSNQSHTISTQSQQPTQKGQNETKQTPQNSQPVVTDYTVSIDKNQRVSISLKGNDNDGDKLIFKIINKPLNALIENFKPSSGSLTYTPNKDYVGDDKFTFTAYDGKMESNIGAVTIHVKDKQLVVKQQTKSQSPENQVKPFPLSYWLENMENTQKLLPLTIGNMTVENAGRATTVLKISSDNHNIYDNIAAQILIAKLNIKNEVHSCTKVNDVIKYGDLVLHSANYQGVGTGIQDLSDPQMKNMIKTYSILTQFNTQGCTAISPIDIILGPTFLKYS